MVSRSGLPRELELGLALREHRLAVAHLLERVLVTAVSHLERRLGGVELGAGRRSRASRTWPCASRVSRASSSTAAAWRTMRGLLGVDGVVVAVGRKAEARAGLLQRRLGLPHAQLEVGRISRAMHLALADAAAEVHGELVEPAGDLDAQRDLLFGGEGARHGDGAHERVLGGGHDLDRPRLGGVGRPARLPGHRRRRAATPSQPNG